MYGERGLIGVIELSTSTALTAEYAMVLPDGVLSLFSRIRLPRGEVSAAALDEMVSSNRLEEAAVELADAGAGIIAFGCTTGSLLRGPGFDASLCERMQSITGIRATTTATAVVNSLRFIGANSVALGTPYDDNLNALEHHFFEAAGFTVTHAEGLDKRDDRDIGRISFEEVRALSRAAVAEPSDALFLSCTNLPTLPIIDQLEDELGLPVVTSNAATIWETFRLLGLHVSQRGYGRLLASSATIAE
jgi:maleate cis-trans isomerase